MLFLGFINATNYNKQHNPTMTTSPRAMAVSLLEVFLLLSLVGAFQFPQISSLVSLDTRPSHHQENFILWEILHPADKLKKRQQIKIDKEGADDDELYDDNTSDDDDDDDDDVSDFARNRRRRKYQMLKLRSQLRREEEQIMEARERHDNPFLMLALVPAFIAFSSWETLSFSLSEFIDYYGYVGKAVDGNAFANTLLRPTINGVVVPVISIALATLVSTTVNVLRARQVELRALVNKEACELRLLRRAVFGMFGTRQHAARRIRAMSLIANYVDQMARECDRGAIDNLEEIELSGGIAANELDRLSAMLHGVDGAAVSRQGSVGAADAIISRLNSYRSERVALLLSVFPTIHWIVLGALTTSICTVFLVESNQTVNTYLNSIQLKSLFAMLVGVFSATATLCVDLADPFTGKFSLESASAQLDDFRLLLAEDVRDAEAEDGVISSATNKYFNTFAVNGNGDLATNEAGYDKASSFGLLSTVYFHLLTGPLASNVRILGDAAAWVASVVASRTRAILAWRRWPWRRGKRASAAAS